MSDDSKEQSGVDAQQGSAPDEHLGNDSGDSPVVDPGKDSPKPRDPVARWTRILLIVVAVLFLWYVAADRVAPWTDQARVDGFIVAIAPKVTGKVKKVKVVQDQLVEAGDVLAEIDPRTYELAVQRAEAELEIAGQETGASTASVAESDRFVPQVGTLSGNPMAAAAGLATLEILRRPGTYEHYFETGEKLMSALTRILEQSGIEGQVVGAPPMFDVLFAGGEVRNYRDTMRGDSAKMARLNGLLRERGILKSENKHYLSTAVDDTDVEQTIAAWGEAIGELAAA